MMIDYCANVTVLDSFHVRNTSLFRLISYWKRLNLVMRTFIAYNIGYMYLNGDALMKAISYTAVRSNLAKTMESICDDHEPVVITRKNERSVVMLSLEDYEALEETSYLLRSPKNMKRLIESISQLENDGGTIRELKD